MWYSQVLLLLYMVQSRSFKLAWHMIVNLSSPHGQSVNDGISTELSSIQYACINEAVSIILSMGQDTLLVKIDWCQCIPRTSIFWASLGVVQSKWIGVSHSSSDRRQRSSQLFPICWLGLFSALVWCHRYITWMIFYFLAGKGLMRLVQFCR